MSVRNAIVLFLALSTLALLVGCGGSSSPPTNQVGFTVGSLSGTYVFSTTGVDSNGVFLALAGTLMADGKGGISQGTMDVVGAEVILQSPVAQGITGSYTIGSDGRGQATISSPAGRFILDLVLTSSSHGLITEYDSNGSGSGTIDLQTALTGLSQLAGSYAFSLAGLDNSGNPIATAGSVALDNSGDVSGGVQDVNDDGFPYPGLNILPAAGAVTLGSGTGPGSIAISTGTFGTFTFDYYPIDATHLKLIETDDIQFLAGDAFTQTGASIPQGNMVFTVAGIGSSGAIAAGGLMTSDGTGNFPSGLEDVNNGGNISPAQIPFSGVLDAAASGPVGGRVVVNMSTFVPAIQYVMYPSSAGVLMLETDSLAITTGTAVAQTSTTLAATNYGFNLSATNISEVSSGGPPFEEDDIAQFLTTTSSFTGVVDINDEGSITPPQALSGSFPNSPPVDATGRGIATTTNFASFVFYVANDSTVLLVETDTNQIGAGTFETQSTPGAKAAVSRVTSVVHPAVRLHSDLRRSTKH